MPCPATDALSTTGAPVTSRPRASRSTSARPSAPRQVRVPRLLDAAPAPCPPRPRSRSSVGGELAVRVEAQALSARNRARARSGRAPPAPCRGESRRLHRGEALGGVEALRAMSRGGLAQDGRRRAASRLSVVDAMGQRVERLGAGGHRQHLAAAVDDGPALGPERRPSWRAGSRRAGGTRRA